MGSAGAGAEGKPDLATGHGPVSWRSTRHSKRPLNQANTTALYPAIARAATAAPTRHSTRAYLCRLIDPLLFQGMARCDGSTRQRSPSYLTSREHRPHRKGSHQLRSTLRPTSSSRELWRVYISTRWYCEALRAALRNGSRMTGGAQGRSRQRSSHAAAPGFRSPGGPVQLQHRSTSRSEVGLDVVVEWMRNFP